MSMPQGWQDAARRCVCVFVSWCVVRAKKRARDARVNCVCVCACVCVCVCVDVTPCPTRQVYQLTSSVLPRIQEEVHALRAKMAQRYAHGADTD